MNGTIDVAVLWADAALLAAVRSHPARLPDLRLREATAAGLLAAAGPRPDVVLIEVTPREGGDPAGDVRSLCRAGHRVLAISRSADPAQLAAIIGTGACLLLGSEQTATAVIAAIRAAGPARAAAVRDRLPGASRPDTSAATPAASSVSPHPGDVAGQAGPRRGAARAYLDRVRERYRETRRAAYTKLDTQQQADGTQASAPGT